MGWNSFVGLRFRAPFFQQVNFGSGRKIKFGLTTKIKD